MDTLFVTKKSAELRLRAARERIAAMDQAGEHYNAVLEMNPQADGIAAALDARRNTAGDLGPLHGVPILLKDNIDTDDMMHTSGGSLALRDRYAPRDAFIVRKLREAGALLLGKANMTELANYVSDDMPNGYSSRGGQVRAVYGGDPSGSSSGCAVAVAAGYVPIAIGTETCGSIISPACEAGIAALKPTVGLVSRSGILPISVSQDTAGPMARRVGDLAGALDVLAGPDSNDPYTLRAPQRVRYARTLADCPAALSGVRLGLYNKDHDGKPSTNPVFLAALDKLRELGAVVEEVRIPSFPSDEMGAVLSNEFRMCMDHALKGSVNCPLTLKEIVAFNSARPEERAKYGQNLLEEALLPGKGVHSAGYIAARAAIQERYTDALNELFSRKTLAVVITPECSSFSVAGYPSATIPVGFEGGRPVPVVFNGTAYSELTLLWLALTLERAL